MPHPAALLPNNAADLFYNAALLPNNAADLFYNAALLPNNAADLPYTAALLPNNAADLFYNSLLSSEISTFFVCVVSILSKNAPYPMLAGVWNAAMLDKGGLCAFPLSLTVATKLRLGSKKIRQTNPPPKKHQKSDGFL